LSANQLSAFTSLVKPLADGSDRKDLITCQLGDSNSCGIAVQLVSAFRDAGWNIPASGYSQAVMMPPPEALMIVVYPPSTEEVTANTELPSGAFEIATFLKKAGVNVMFVGDAKLPRDRFRIVVGTHP
jgi:hypothetical protein